MAQSGSEDNTETDSTVQNQHVSDRGGPWEIWHK